MSDHSNVSVRIYLSTRVRNHFITLKTALAWPLTLLNPAKFSLLYKDK